MSEKNKKKGFYLPTIILGLIVTVIFLLAIFTYQVPATERALVLRMGRIISAPEGVTPGLHFRWPLPFEEVIKYDVRLRTFDGKIGKYEESTTRDKRQVVIGINVFYRIKNLNQFKTAASLEAAEDYLSSRMRTAKAAVIGLYNYDQLINTDPKKMKLGEMREKMLAEIEARAEEMCKAERLGREGKLPKRVCHCDTKVNNMMFDKEGKVLCIIDLDTIMSNFIFSDYGDFLRTAANTVAEDCPEMGKVQFRMDIFKAFTEGYLKSAKSFLLPIETDNLPYATALFPYMQCVRFLWDYLNGDKYWKCQYPDHNFVRANNQLHLLLSIEKHYAEMRGFVDSVLNG